MHSPLKSQPKSIKQIVQELVLKEMEKDHKRRLNIVIVPMRLGQQWGSRNLKKITPSTKRNSEHTLKFSPINCSQISPDNLKEQERKKYQKLLNLVTSNSKQISREEKQRPHIQSRLKSYSLNLTKPRNVKLPSLPKHQIQPRVSKAISLAHHVDTIEGYQIEVDDMDFEIDEYLKLKSVHSIQQPDF